LKKGTRTTTGAEKEVDEQIFGVLSYRSAKGGEISQTRQCMRYLDYFLLKEKK